jgi:hypothetical protein
MQCDAAKQRSCAVHAGTYATRSNNAAATPAAGTPASSTSIGFKRVAREVASAGSTTWRAATSDRYLAHRDDLGF